MPARAAVSLRHFCKLLGSACGLLFLATVYAPAFATIGGFHSYTSADERYSIDFAFGNGELVEKGEAATLSFREIDKTVLEQKKSICRSTVDPTKTFDIVEERYLLHISVIGRENTDP